MNSIPLTESFRRRICLTVIGDRFEKREAQFSKERKSLAIACYNELYTRSTRSKMAALPQGWLPEASEIGARLGGEVVYLHFDGKFNPKPNTRRFLAKHHNRIKLSLDAHDPITERYRALTDQIKEASQEKAALTREIDSVLCSVTTTGRLLAVWPEVEPFLKKLTPSSVPLPAIPVEKLNAKLGLAMAAE